MLSVRIPTDGILQISVAVKNDVPSGVSIDQPADGQLNVLGALAITDVPSGVSVAQPAQGKIRILGAVVLGFIDGSGNFVQG